MIITIILILKILGVAWFCTQIFEFIDTINEATKSLKHLGQVMKSKLQCLKCISFWITLGITFNFPLACVVALIANLLDTHLLTGNIKL